MEPLYPKVYPKNPCKLICKPGCSSIPAVRVSAVLRSTASQAAG